MARPQLILERIAWCGCVVVMTVCRRQWLEFEGWGMCVLVLQEDMDGGVGQ